ncbi:MAG: hypothetical protein ACJATT_005027 [Myxococcota bacterium]|jgi:hypothetical protein
MRTLISLSVVALAIPLDAFACGGFFCNNDFPVDQSAEQIVFGVDSQTGDTTVHVTVSYEGESDDFAWIVPVPTLPRLDVSSDALFTAISNATQPQFILERSQTGICNLPEFGGRDLEDSDTAFPTDADGGGVEVVAKAQVGPYDTLTLRAESSSELLTWLNEAGYDLPSNLEPVLAPYIASGQYFVALKLSAGNDTGDLAPLAMTYPSTSASVPIQLTSIAATPDMPIEVYVLGEARAVPDNYLHVQINESAIDWFTGGSNYKDVISLAADEAGGQAFATDYSGTTANLRGTLWQEGQVNLESLRDASSAAEFVQMVFGLGFPPSASLLDALMDVVPFPDELAEQGLTPGNFYDCLECYSEYLPQGPFDADGAAAQFEVSFIDGLRLAEELFASFDHVTRLTSSMDASEMTVDPMFVFNTDMEQRVSNIHIAQLITHCGLGEGWDNGERVLELADGRRIRLPAASWMWENDETEYDLMGDLTTPAALVIEDLSATGEGEVLFDFSDIAAERARQFDRPGCACNSGGSLAGLWTVGLLLLGLRRRRA